MALYEDLGAWSGKAFSSVSRLMFELNALPEKNFAENFREPFGQFEDAVGGQFFPLFGRVQIYAADAVRDAFLNASPSIVGLGGKYDKDNAVNWVTRLFNAVSDLQDVLRVTLGEVASGIEGIQPSQEADMARGPKG
jgi:hypothetical protein